MKTFLAIVLTSIFWLTVLGLMVVDHQRQMNEETQWLAQEHYQAKQRAATVTKENRALYREIANLKQGRG